MPEQIPFEDSTVDVVTSNRVINLVPDKQKAFEEICRIQISDLVLSKPVSAKSKSNVWEFH